LPSRYQTSLPSEIFIIPTFSNAATHENKIIQ